MERIIQTGKNNQSLVKALQIISFVFMLFMVVLCLALLKRNNISVGNAEAFAALLSGNAVRIAAIIITFTVVKSFALVFPPAIIFAVSGLVFENIWAAFFVNFLATMLSMILPYYLGRFAGRDLLNSMKNRYPKVKKLDAFAAENDVVIVLLIKAGGILPADLSSLLFGSMNIPFRKFFIIANIGMLPLNILWTLLGARGELSNPLSFLYILPILVFAVIGSLCVRHFQKRKNAS